MKLRGACIHHDNGLLGAAAIGRAEERRIEILKAAGFNAIRASHNPLSIAMIDACDRLGMLVIDETFDMWTTAKNAFDYSLSFPEWWERDVESLVAKDFNHPSVIIYSIGNEVLDAGNPHGARWGRALAEKVRALDATRYTTNAVSGFVATIPDLLPELQKRAGELRGKVGVNDLIGEMHHLFDEISLSDEVTDMTEEIHSVVDIVGHNYAEARYVERPRAASPPGRRRLRDAREGDRRAVGTGRRSNPHVIGDFTWTGWDYLGEAGIGGTRFDDEEGFAPYPWLTAWCGDIDITGHRRPASYYREIVFGLRDRAVHRGATGPAARSGAAAPRLGVDRLALDLGSAGSMRGAPVHLEVYSDADEVELLLERPVVGTRARRVPRTASVQPSTFHTKPGELVAVARVGGRRRPASILRSLSRPPCILHASADRSVIRAEDDDLAYITIEFRDADGTLATSTDATVVQVAVEGSAVLQGLGSARPGTEESFLTRRPATTFEGRALAIVRPTGPGEITVTVDCEGLGVGDRSASRNAACRHELAAETD